MASADAVFLLVGVSALAIIGLVQVQNDRLAVASAVSISSSSKIGSETTYFSLAQFPRSCIRQRSLQNGKSLCTSESVEALQMGHR